MSMNATNRNAAQALLYSQGVRSMERAARKGRGVIGDPEFLAPAVDVRKKGASRVLRRLGGVAAATTAVFTLVPGMLDGARDPNPSPAVVANRLNDAPEPSLKNGGLTQEDIELAEDIAEDPARLASNQEDMARHIANIHSEAPSGAETK